MINHYAQIDPATMICFAVSSLSAEVIADNLIALTEPDTGLIGMRWTGAAWEAVPVAP